MHAPMLPVPMVACAAILTVVFNLRMIAFLLVYVLIIVGLSNTDVYRTSPDH